MFTDGNREYANITAKVSKGRVVIYKGEKTSLSASALKILNEQFGKKWKAARGPDFWTYKGKTITYLDVFD